MNLLKANELAKMECIYCEKEEISQKTAIGRFEMKLRGRKGNSWRGRG